jgi:hypothetical protein
MTTLELPFRSTARTTAIAGLLVFSVLRTLSGLAVVLGVVVFVILNEGTDRSSGSPSAGQLRPRVSAIGASFATTPQLVFYLVSTQAEADLVAADDYDNWASGDRGASDKRVHILFARNPLEEAEVHRLILQEIGAARTPSVVTISDRRLHPD